MRTTTNIHAMWLGGALGIAGAFVIASASPSWAIQLPSNTGPVRAAAATPSHLTEVRYYRRGYYHRRYYRRGYYDPGAAVAGGLALGLLGAAAGAAAAPYYYYGPPAYYYGQPMYYAPYGYYGYRPY
ncbi:hypothetical protein RZS28_00885 [Methylocapsa polymorpha]|uniref:Transmembrane protein n=1 Tax=Methylocapsa polymorpha TaxID=3080828 RepID=A0ABZ0HTM0_9HYPH|nr:hypothetical protein RZS28_00885 [Methylocapsa sp. RX1]